MYAMSIARTPTCVNNYFDSRNEATANRNHAQHTHIIQQQRKRLQHKILNFALVT